MGKKVLPFLLGDKDFTVIVHEKDILEVFFFRPFPFYAVFSNFLDPSPVNWLTLLLTPRLAA